MLSIKRGIYDGVHVPLKGFTLAEVLITLGIIGVVAAMTLPVLSTKIRNNELQTGFKKAYSNLNQVMSLINYELGGAMNNDDYNFTRSFKKTISEKFKGVDCDKYDGINCLPSNGSENPYSNLSGKSRAYYVWLDDGQFLTPDGMMFFIQNSSMTVNGVENPLTISVDVNGVNKKPNRWGMDLFTFQFINGKLVPMGNEKSLYPIEDYPQYCSTTDTDQQNGINCTVKAVTDKDYFKKLP